MVHKQIISTFEMAAGSVCGTDHARAGRNNQDAWHLRREPGCIAAVVSDGCGSSPRAEAGAIVGARLVAESLVARAPDLVARDGTRPDPAAVVRHLAGVRDDVLAQLRVVAQAMGPSLHETIHDNFLFTVVAAWLTTAGLVVFSLGDGTVAINGNVRHLGPFPDNRPPYLGYGLLGDDVSFRIHAREPLDRVETLLLGSDGVCDLETVEEELIPGRSESVGPLRQLWREDRFFDNPDGLRRFLALANRTVTRPDWEQRRQRKQVGLLRDDTTVVVLRRRPESVEVH